MTGSPRAVASLVPLGFAALAALTACPASQVGQVTGPGVYDPPVPATEMPRSTARPAPPPPDDTDGDGVVDDVDQCPDQAGADSGVGGDGCPVEDQRVPGEITPAPMAPIYFPAGKIVWSPDAMVTLDNLAELLRLHPEIQLFEVAGHTDGHERGDHLDGARASAVVRYLVNRGVEGHRLAVKSYGATRPLAPDTSDANRARNRRVDFSIALRVDEPDRP